jgi:uncharacterized membrane protein
MAPLTLAPVTMAALARPVPTGPAYSVLLVLHVGATLVGFGALVTTGVQAARLRRGLAGVDSGMVRRYFRPGVNWPARALYAVPVFGFALLAESNGAFAVDDGWVVAGLVLWLVAAVVAEAVVWPGERRIQVLVAHRWNDPDAVPLLDRECRRVVTASGLLAAVFLAAVVVMVGKP